MKKLVCALTLLIPLCIGKSMTIAQEQDSFKPPVAKKIAKTTTIHGETLTDDYYWLREKNNPEVISYLEAENAYTDSVMKPTSSRRRFPLALLACCSVLARVCFCTRRFHSPA